MKADAEILHLQPVHGWSWTSSWWCTCGPHFLSNTLLWFIAIVCLIYVPQMCCVIFVLCPLLSHDPAFAVFSLDGKTNQWFRTEYIHSQEQSLHLGHTHLPSTCVRCSKVTFCPPASPAPHHLRSMWMDEGRNEMSAAACFSSGCLPASCGSLSGEKISPCLTITTLRYCAGLQRHIFNLTVFL